MNARLRWFSLLAVLGIASLSSSAESPLKNTINGTPKISAIDAIRFGPQGVLLIGDGRGSQLVAIETGDLEPKKWGDKGLENIDEKLAGKIGTTGKGIEILHMAVNPASHTAYFLIRKQDDKKSLILTLDGTGKIAEFSLENVKHVAIPLPKGESSAVSRVTDLAWMSDRVIVGAVCSEEFASKICSIPTPLDPKAGSTSFSTETYHVAHHRWETKAPMTCLMPFKDDGKDYVVGAFACTPVVKYPLTQVEPNAKVKGESILELGSGNQPRTMFTYQKDGKSYVLMNTFRFHHKTKPFGWSPYWTVRIDLGVLSEKEKINDKALLRLNSMSKPATEQVKFVDEYLGVIHLDQLDKDRALVVKEEEKGGLTLAVLMLP